MHFNLNKIGLLLISILMASISNGQTEQLPPWQLGYLDIHHINTGRGDAAFMVFPDGTTMLVDAGDMSETHERTTSSRNAKLVPNRSKTAPEWIVDYIDQFLPKKQERRLDYALITHYHDDHFGEVDSLRKIAPGGYQLTGIMEVGTLIPIKKLIDRGFDFPLDLKDGKVQSQERFSNDKYGLIPTLKEYWKFIDYQSEKVGLKNEALKVGSANQIVLRHHPKDFPEFLVQNIASNGNIWTGFDDSFHSLFKKGEFHGENPLSNAIRIDFGKFNYYTGGDIAGIDGLGQTDINALESHVAPVVGAVDVATLNHHGNRDSQNPFYVRTIRPRVWIQQNWTADHPGEEVLRRILSKQLYPGDRDIFSTIMLQGTKDVIGGRLDQYKSQNGHIVVRVYDNGDTYKVYVLNDASEEREILTEHGPYKAR
ncbi:MBL fold metallo-hydrolase [Flagellimonas okinawensis]|uniref:MBL fold metallo-hydrolase n=1 Tax=Flagellimonas okinawensis TaxID=3031324 RepID=A0ABT5XPQ2_9FLAO|nr:MBL fold metallo-hydrolase [[Muricauda] okinawensis]MDF0707881.1 MBL fold metallo-hydrolase [[Muricauda] okinawensis]